MGRLWRMLFLGQGLKYNGGVSRHVLNFFLLFVFFILAFFSFENGVFGSSDGSSLRFNLSVGGVDNLVESSGVRDISVSVSVGSNASVNRSFFVSVLNGSAVSGVDFGAVSDFVIVVPAGDFNGTGVFSLSLVNDNLYEGDEFFVVNVSDRGSYGFVDNLTDVVLADDETSPFFISFSSSLLEVDEGDGLVVVNVSASFPFLFGTVYPDAVVNVSVLNGTAVSGDDFEAVEMFSFTIPSGSVSASSSFNLSLVDDLVFEGNEALRIRFDSYLPGVDYQDSVNLNLVDNDVHPSSINLSVNASSFSERGDFNVSVTASFLGNISLTNDVVVNANLSSGSAVSGVDFSPLDINVTIPAGRLNGTSTFNFKILNDNIAEESENLTLEGSANGFVVNPVVLTILDDDVSPSGIRLSVNPFSAYENEGSVLVNITAQFNRNTVLPEDFNVSVTIVGDTAIAGDDFESVEPFVVTIPEGRVSGSKALNLTLIDDNLGELFETVRVYGNAGGFFVLSSSFTIDDDDAIPDTIHLVVEPEAVMENSSAALINVSAKFPKDSGVLINDTRITVRILNNTAFAGIDFMPVPDFEIVIPSRQSNGSVELNLTPVNNSFFEANKILTIRGNASDFTVNDAVLTISEDEVFPSELILSFSPTQINESANSTNVTVSTTFQRSNNFLRNDTNITISIAGNTAMEGQDFASVNSFNITIPAGQSSGSASFSLQTLDDRVVEGNETVLISVSPPFMTNSADKLNIVDDDDRPSHINISLEPISVSEEGGSTNFTMLASFPSNSNVLARNTSVSIYVISDSATKDDDFVAVPAFAVTIPAGSLNVSSNFSIEFLDDRTFEGDEVFQIVGTSSDFTLVNSIHNVSIIENDVRPSHINLKLNNTNVSESNGTVFINVSASLPEGSAVLPDDTVVQINVTSLTAMSNSDFETVESFNVTIPALRNGGYAVFNLTVVDDNVFEGSEVLMIGASAATFTINVLNSSITISDNDEKPNQIVLRSNPASVLENSSAVINVSAQFAEGSSVLTDDLNVTISIGDGTAVSGIDFDAVSDFNVTIPALRINGSASFNLRTVDNNVADIVKLLTVSGDASNFTVQSTNLIITEDDVAPSTINLNLSPLNASENNGSVTFNVSVSFPDRVVLPTDTNVSVSIANGTAVSGSDFGAVSDFNVTIPAGRLSSSETFSLSIADDNVFEGSEVLTVPAGAAGFRINPSATSITILENDLMPNQIFLASNISSVNETDDTRMVKISASFHRGSAVLPEDVNITVRVLDGTAVSGSDFGVVSDFNVTIPAGLLSGSGTFNLSVVDDNIAEGQENLLVNGSAANFNVESVNLSISDDDVAPSSVGLSLDRSSVSEGDGLVVFNVSAAFSGSVVLPVDTNVSVSFLEGSTASESDFGVVSDFNVTIPAGMLNGSGTFSLSLVDDSVFEGSEVLMVNVSSAGFTVNPSAVNVTIVDNDVKPTQIVLTSDPSSVSESGGAVVFNVSAAFSGSVVLTEDVNVTVSVASGTAFSGSDFGVVSDFNVTIPAGMLNGSGAFSLNVVDDNVAEGQEGLSINGDASGFTVNVITLSISDDDVAPSSVGLSLDRSSVSEGDGLVVFNVSAAFSGSVVLPVDTNVSVSFLEGSTASESDFGVVSDFNVTIPAGMLNGSGTFSLSLVDDSVFEGSEVLMVNVSSAGFTVNPSAVNVTIVDNDVKPARIVLVSNVSSVSESGGAVVFNVSAAFSGSVVLTEDTDVTVSVASGTAFSGVDFDAVSDFNVTILAGMLSGSGTFSLSVVDDNTFEGQEALSISGDASGFTISAITLNINDDDTAPSSVGLSLDRSSVSEGDGLVVFNVSAAFSGNVVLTEDTNVTVSIADDTAVSGSDFGAVSDFNVTIPAGSLSGSGTFSLSVVDDTVFEGPETLSVSGNSSGLTVSPSSITITIQENDLRPTQIVLTSNPSSSNENSGTTTINISAKFPDGSAVLPVDTNVSVSVLGGTAASGVDFEEVSNFSIIIPAFNKNSSAILNLTVVDNNMSELDKTLRVAGSAAGFNIQSITLSIVEDDAAPSKINLTLDRASISENDGSATFNVSVRFSGNVVLPVDTNVSVSVLGGTATSGVDFGVVSDFNVTIPAGMLSGSGTFSLSVVDDNVFEGSEALIVNASSGSFTINSSAITINDDDLKPSQIILKSNLTSFDEGSGRSMVNVSAGFPVGSSVLTEDTVVTLSVVGVTAVVGDDFGAVSDFNVTIPAFGVSGSAVFNLTVIDNNVVEDGKSLRVSGFASGFSLDAVVLEIDEDDVAPSLILLSLDRVSVSEGSGSTLINVSAGFPVGSAVLVENTTFNVSVEGLSAVVGEDFVSVEDFNVTIPAFGVNGSAVFNLTVLDDNVVEGSEVLVVNASSSSFTINPSLLNISLIENDVRPNQVLLRTNLTSFDEGSGRSMVNVSAGFPVGSSVLTEDTVVTLSVVGVTAVVGDDFGAVSDFNVTIPAFGVSGSAVFNLTVIDNNVVEDGKSLRVSGFASGFSLDAVVLEIDEDDVAPSLILLSLDRVSVSEGSGSTLINVSAGFPVGSAVLVENTTFNVSVEGLSAVVGEDFVSVEDFNVTIPAFGVNGSAVFNLTVLDDNVVEGSEVLVVNASSSGFTISPSMFNVTILDDDVVSESILLDINVTRVSETAGTSLINVSASFPVGSSVLTKDTNVTVFLDNGTGFAGQDFSPVSDFNVTIPAFGVNGSAVFNLTVLDDNVVEGSEVLVVNASSSGFTISPSMFNVTILDDDVVSESILLDINVTRVSETAGTSLINVSASFPVGSSVLTEDTNVSISIVGVTLVSGVDFSVTTSDFNVTIPAFETSGFETVSLTLLDDNLVEGDESLRFVGNSSGFTIIGPEDLIISDDESPPTRIRLSTDPQNVSENASLRAINFSVSFVDGVGILSNDVDILLNLTSEGTAVAGSDFVGMESFNVSIPALRNKGFGILNLTLLSDNIVEGNETLTFRGSTSDFILEPSSVNITIVDDDLLASHVILAVSPRAVNESSLNNVINVSVSFPEGSGVLTEDVVVSLALRGLSASGSVDFLSISDFNVTIAAGELNGSESFNLTVLDDNLVEGSETLRLVGSSSEFAVPNASNDLIILDDDVRPDVINLRLSPSRVSEGDGSRVVNVSAAFETGTGVLLEDVSVTINVSGASANGITDFTRVESFDLTIPARKKVGSETFNLSLIDDDHAENDETILINGTSAGFKVGHALLIILANDQPSSGGSGGGGGGGGGAIVGFSDSSVGVFDAPLRKGWDSLDPELSGVFDLSSKNLTVMEVELVVEGVVSDASMEVTVLSSKPPDLESPPGRVYEYFEIEHDVPSDLVGKGMITFAVSKSWMSSNGFNNDDISLLRYDPDLETWETLKVRAVSEDSKHVTFSAEVENFSIFVISVAIKTLPEKILPLQVPYDDESSLQKEKNDSMNESTNDGENVAVTSAEKLTFEPEETPKNSNSWWLIIGLVLVIAILLESLLAKINLETRPLNKQKRAKNSRSRRKYQLN